MTKNKVIITQSNYIPWKGYFTSMRKATHFIVYDEVQYTKRDWRNRNKIISPSGPRWLSIPVKVSGRFEQKIKDTEISDQEWGKTHWNLIEQNYKKAPFFRQYSRHFEELYLNCKYKLLSDVNLAFLKKTTELLDIDIEFIDSGDFPKQASNDSTSRLVEICELLQADEYFTGPAAKNYIRSEAFLEKDIKLSYYDLEQFPVYQQQWEGFEHKVSILDMFFNLGSNTIKYFN